MKTETQLFRALTACPAAAAAVENIFWILQGTVATFSWCGGQVQNHLCGFFHIPFTKKY